MSREKLSYYDEMHTYKGYVLVNELYEDSEGFYKNGWQWGVLDEDYVYDPIWLEGLSSNSYANFSEAYKKFCQLVDEEIKNNLK